MKRVITAIGLSSLFLVTAVFAQLAPTENLTTRRSPLIEEKPATIARCTTVESRVGKQIANFEKNRSRHVASFIKTKTRMTALIERLEGEGYDVSKLRADLVTYDGLVKQFADDYATYIGGLNETKTYACGKSSGEFKTKLTAARAQLKTAHDDGVAVRTFWAKTLRPGVLALKTQVKADKTTKVEPTKTEVTE